MKILKRLLGPVVSILIMFIIFRKINLHDVRDSMVGIDRPLLGVTIFLFIPQILTASFRWKQLISKKLKIGLWESTKLILAANSLNILLPSRIGDLSKAYFLKKEGKLEINRGTNIILFEKYMDLASLCCIILLGILLHPGWNKPNLVGGILGGTIILLFPALYAFRLDRLFRFAIFDRYKILGKVRRFLLDSQSYLQELKTNKVHLFSIVLISIFMWCLHILQFLVFFRALHSDIAAGHIFRLIPLALLFGLVPITVAGIGTRDSAMIYLLSPYVPLPKIVAVGLFASIRYFVPGILGLPFLNQYMVKATQEVQNPVT